MAEQTAPQRRPDGARPRVRHLLAALTALLALVAMAAGIRVVRGPRRRHVISTVGLAAATPRRALARRPALTAPTPHLALAAAAPVAIPAAASDAAGTSRRRPRMVAAACLVAP